MTNFKRFNQQLNFLIEIDKLKQILRETILMDASRKENDAEHTWHMAIAALILTEYADETKLNICKVLKMVLLHDIIEVDAGDVFIYGNVNWKVKSEKEKKAAKRIFGLLPNDQTKELLTIWTEYEEAQTPEARYAHALDNFMPLLHNYKTKGLQWKKHKVTKDMVLKRNYRIKRCSKFLWDYVISIVNDAVDKGYLKV